MVGRAISPGNIQKYCSQKWMRKNIINSPNNNIRLYHSQVEQIKQGKTMWVLIFTLDYLYLFKRFFT